MGPTGSWHAFSQPLGLDAARGAGVAISTEGYSGIEITNSDFVAQVRLQPTRFPYRTSRWFARREPFEIFGFGKANSPAQIQLDRSVRQALGWPRSGFRHLRIDTCSLLPSLGRRQVTFVEHHRR